MVLVAGVFGIWLVAGSDSYWIRMIVTAGALFPAFAFEPLAVGYAGMALGWTVLFSVVAHRIAAWRWHFATGRNQFTLWNLAGLIFACGLVFAFVRLASIAYEDSPGPVFFDRVVGTCYLGLCYSVMGFPLLIPPSLRTKKLYWCVGGILLGGIPLALGVLASLVNPMFLLLLPVFLPLIHAAGAFFFWAVLFPMELGGMFASYELPAEETAS